MTQQYDSFNEKAKLVDKALRFTGGDINKAKAMVAGQYQDIVAVKGKFFISSLNNSGLFIAFFNVFEEYIPHINSVIVNDSNALAKTRIFDDWKTFYHDIILYANEKGAVDSSNFTNFLLDSFIGYDVFPDVQESNLDNLTRTITEIITKSFNIKDVQCQIELDTTTSISLMIEDIYINVPESADDSHAETSDKSAEDLLIEKIESEVDYVIEGKISVSPVRGKYINDIAKGEKIKVLLPGSDPVSRKLLTVLHAIDEKENITPIVGRVKEKIPLEKSGYIIYAFVAKGVLAKIVEEENVKIEIDSPKNITVKDKGKKSESGVMVLMLVFVILIIIAGFILINLL